MRPEPNILIEKFRTSHPQLPPSPPGVNYGFFQDRHLRIMSSGDSHGSEDGTAPDVGKWEHVSVSCANRCPTWEEMQHVKELFWGDEETVIQFHPKKSKYINRMPHCLHMWKKTGEDHELPPEVCV